MSGYAQELIGKGAAEFNFLPKPFTPSALLDKVHEVLDTQSSGGIHETWMLGRRAGSGTLLRNTSRVIGATSPSPRKRKRNT